MTMALELQGLRKTFQTTIALQDATLSVAQGELFALLGPNGAGKTTTLRMVAGLLRPDAGDAFVLGKSITTQPEAAKQVLAYLPDDPMLYGKLRPPEMLEFVAGLWGLDAHTANTRATHWLKHMDLWVHRHQFIESFSRGMKQKMALAAALIHDPNVMILDEPLTGLDAAASRMVKDLLLDFVAKGGTVVLTTHILEVAERLATRIAIIDQGRVVAQGTLQELRDQTNTAGASLEDVFLRLTQHNDTGET